MVCKKSLYCLKNGPCATYQIRKQIWEDNIRFRESLKTINQSDHYWSFQITNDNFSDLDEPPVFKSKNKSSLKLRNFNDCASITHDFNHEDNDSNITCFCCSKAKNTQKPKYEVNLTDKLLDSKSSSPAKLNQSLLVSNQPNVSTQRLNSCSIPLRSNKEIPDYSCGFRKSMSSAQLRPSTKLKFSSQSTLFQPKTTVEMKRFPSTQCIPKVENSSEQNSNVKENKISLPRSDTIGKCKLNENEKRLSNIKMKSNVNKQKEIKLLPWLFGTPLSRTTKKMLSQEKQRPFATFGCNNINDIVGCKKTHNVFASTNEVFPNALSAKQHRKDLIQRSLKIEKQFRKSLLQDNIPKKVNHSSLWLNESNYSDQVAIKKKNDAAALQKRLRKLAL